MSILKKDKSDTFENIMTIHTLLAKLRKTAVSTRDLGNQFERLMLQYLITDPVYKNKYSDVWLWMDWPDREGPDTGIDLVAKERYTGEYSNNPVWHTADSLRLHRQRQIGD
jgi:predicted helicase